MKEGTLWTKSPLAGLGLRCSGGFRIASKKWTDQCEDCSLKKNETRTSKVGAISKAQKAQNIFFRKKLEIFEKKILRKMSHSAEKNQKGGPFSLGRFCRLRFKKYKMKGGTLWRQKNFQKKVAQCRKKSKKSKGGTL